MPQELICLGIMAAHLELPFLYQTRTILRRHPRVSCVARRRRLLSNQSQQRPPLDHEVNESDNVHGGFLKEKARQVAESSSSKVPTSFPNTVGTRINSTITASERRAFETILRFTPKQTEPSGVKQQSPLVDAVDTDVENILNIFSSSIASHHADRAESRQQRPKTSLSHSESSELSHKVDNTAEETGISNEPVSGIVSSSTSEHAFTRPNKTAQQARESASDHGTSETTVLASESPGQQLQPLLTDQAASKVTITGPTLFQERTPSGVEDSRSTEPSRLPLGEQSLEEISESLHLSRVDESIQQAVRVQVTEIADALQAAATSPTKRGDLAMWEVCETQIFSMATQLSPPQERQQRPRWTEQPPRFTFTKTHSDNVPELIAAQASLRNKNNNTTTPATTIDSSTNTDLAVLHHVYPAALLLALRLYIHHFPASPLAHNLLPRIRELGHTSYVLGAGPQFYNSLLSLVWLTRSSLRQVDALLAEMERGGVELTEETYRILRQIEDDRAADLGREEGKAGVLRGSRGAAWWKRHEQVFWFPRILDWLGVVAKRLTMRDMVE